MSPEQDFKSKIEKIRNRFITQLGTSALAFREIQQQFESGLLSETGLEELRLGSHRIRGIAPMFGINELGNIANSVENNIDKMMLHPGNLDLKETLISSIDELLLEMGAVFLNAS
jgi:chemotaxis protein histidine kinase CheA